MLDVDQIVYEELVAAGVDPVVGLRMGNLLAKALAQAEYHELRDLRWRLKQANRDRGRQGETIYRLRGEVALLHGKLHDLLAGQGEAMWGQEAFGIRKLAEEKKVSVIEASAIEGLV